jgi:hypothetical protein
MRILTRILVWCYSQCLKLYPADFRATFGEEMQTVLVQSIVERAGTGRILAVFLREVQDLPGNLLRLYWSDVGRREITMTTMTDSKEAQPSELSAAERQPGSWRDAILAGLPHLLMGLLFATGRFGILDIYEVSQTGNLIFGTGLALLVIGMLVFAWRRGWPLWSASWYLYATWVTLAVVGLTIESLNLEDSWRYTNVLFISWILLCIIGYFILLSRSKLHGLLSVAFLFPMLSVMMLEFIPNPIEGWLALGVGLVAAIAAGAIVRVGEFRLALGLVLGINLIAGLAAAYVSEYKMLDLPAGIPAHVPRFSRFLGLLGLYALFGLGVIAVPFALRRLWNFGKRKLAH